MLGPLGARRHIGEGLGFSAASAAAWTPADLGVDLWAWYAPDAYSPSTGTWTETVAARDLVQATAGVRPTAGTAENGHAMASFDGAMTYLNGQALVDGTARDRTIIAAYRLKTGTGTAEKLFYTKGADEWGVTGRWSSGTVALTTAGYNVTASSAAVCSELVSTGMQWAAFVMESPVKIYVNGVQQTVVAPVAWTAKTIPTSTTIGVRSNGATPPATAGQYAAIELGDLFFVNRAMAPDEITNDVASYMLATWGI